MNHAIEAGLSGFASFFAMAIVFAIGWLAFKLFNYFVDFSKPDERAMNLSAPKRTTVTIETLTSKDPEPESGTTKDSPVEQSQVAKSISQSHEPSLTKNKKIAVAILVFVLIFVPTKFCPTSGYGCLISGWDFIFNFGSYDRVDMERMIIQLVIAGLICWLLVRNKN